MAHNVSGASLTPIYERLNGVTNYHPMDAETFSDWSTEAGDIVTVTRDGKEYSTPIHTSSFTWRGKAPLMAINATGNQKRDPVSKISKRKYSGSGAAMRNDQYFISEIASEDETLRSVIFQTATNIFTGVYDEVSDNFSTIEQTSTAIALGVNSAKSSLYTVIVATSTNIYSGIYDDLNGTFATIEQTSTMIATSVVAARSSIYSTIQQTSTAIMAEVGKKNRVFVQYDDPALTVSDLHDGDIWVKSSGIRTWSQVGQKVWSAIGSLAWRSLYGSVWYVRKNNAWEKNADESSVVEQKVRIEHNEDSYSILASQVNTDRQTLETKLQVTASQIESTASAARSTLYSVIRQTATNVFSGVYDKVSDHFSTIEQTATAITLAVTASKSSLYTVIQATATGVFSGVYDKVSDNFSTISQTSTAITLAVTASKSSLCTVIQATATGVFSGVYDKVSNNFSTISQTSTAITLAVTAARSSLYTTIEQTSTAIMTEVGKKNRVFVQMNDPADTVSDLHDGDIWVKSSGIRTWSQVGSKKWSAIGSLAWRSLYGSVWYVRKNNAWEKNADESAVVEQRVRIEHNESSYSILGSQVDLLGNSMETKLQVTASKIESTASATRSTLYSVIRQTATNVFSGVYDKVSDHFSTIEQTATAITLAVTASKSSLYTVIQATATGVFSGVYDKVSDNFSTISQTSTAITLAVTASKSSLYTVIKATATGVFSGVYDKVSNNFSTIVQTSTLISTRVGKGEVISSINQTAESVTINASKVNLNGYVQATDLTANYIAGILVNSSVLSTNYIFTKSLEIGTGGATINGYSCALEDGIKAIQLTRSGDTYTLQKKHFYSSDWSTVGTFSRATQLSGAWGGTVAAGKYYQVEATPQGDIHYSPQLDGMSVRNDKTWASDKKSFTQTLYVYDEDGAELYEENMSFSTTDSYNAGKADLSWSYGSLSHSNSAPSSYSKKYEVDASYRYWYFNVTVNGVSKRILLDVLGAI